MGQIEKGIRMTDMELEQRLKQLITDTRESHPAVAGILCSLAGSLLAGEPWLLRLFALASRVSAEFVQFVGGDGETRQ